MIERAQLLLFLSAMMLFAGCGGAAVNPTPSNSQADQNSASNATGPNGEASRGPTRVVIDSPDQALIVGSYFESPNPNSPGVLLLHQWQSDRHSFDEFAKQLQADGFSVLSIDGRGFGESTKTTDGKMVAPERTDEAVKAMLSDVRAAVDFLSRQKNVDPNRLGIVGASYGSSLAIIFAADDPRIRTVALLSPGLNYFGNMQTEPAVKKYGNRDLFLAASTEDRESADAVTKLGSDAGPPGPALRSSMVVTTGGHGTDLFKSDGKVQDSVRQFLVNSLKK